ncbi:hypothetical protein, partial [Amycolatopsis anabasis]|uniref:hypothetical protein n=1 Tax=Amycolatopsis anabasis TaxID=1840409 RepID=UPI001C552203
MFIVLRQALMQKRPRRQTARTRVLRTARHLLQQRGLLRFYAHVLRHRHVVSEPLRRPRAAARPWIFFPHAPARYRLATTAGYSTGWSPGDPPRCEAVSWGCR